MALARWTGQSEKDLIGIEKCPYYFQILLLYVLKADAESVLDRIILLASFCGAKKCNCLGSIYYNELVANYREWSSVRVRLTGQKCLVYCR